MSRIKRVLKRLNKKLHTPTQEEQYLSSASSLSNLEHRQQNIQRGGAPYQTRVNHH